MTLACADQCADRGGIAQFARDGVWSQIIFTFNAAGWFDDTLSMIQGFAGKAAELLPATMP